MQLSPDKISRYVLYGTLGVIAIIFLAYFVAGSEQVGSTADEQTAPVLVGFLIGFLIFMIVITTIAALVMLIKSLLMRKNK